MTTQFASASYQEIVDLHTESDTVSVIGIHTPQGDTPRKMFGGFFDQFKKFKYLGCSIKLVPAARLPADPLQVSYEAGDTTIDPRDMLNPLMFHGCHGNDMGVILNRLYSLNSVDGFKSDSVVMEQDTTAWTLEGILAGEVPNFQLEDLYYKALTDNTWKKAHPQRGFRKSGLRPLVYKMSTNMQMLGSGQSLLGVDGLGIPGRMIGDDGEYTLPAVNSGRQFFTPGLTGLGWLDTRNVLTSPVEVNYDGSQYSDLDDAIPALESAIRSATLDQQNASESSLPLVYMGMILLPPAYKTEQYFRMIINHHFAFKDFRGISFSNNLVSTPAYNNFNDEDFQQGGDDVDPDDPDDPGDGGDDSGGGGSTSGAIVLSDSYAKGISVGGVIYDTYAKLQYSDNVEYSMNVTTTSGAVRSANFIVPQNFVSGGDTPIGWYIVFESNNRPVITINNETAYVIWIFYYNGILKTWYALSPTGNGYEFSVYPIEPSLSNIDSVVTRAITPTNSAISSALGTTTEFEGVNLG